MTEAKSTYPETPELDRQLAVLKDKRSPSNVLTEFYDWLCSQGYHIAQYAEREGYRDQMLEPVGKSPEQLLADFFGIDRDKIEAERRAILEHLRESAAAER